MHSGVCDVRVKLLMSFARRQLQVNDPILLLLFTHSIEFMNSINFQFARQPEEFIAVPIFSILETIDFHNFEPAVACLFVLIGSCAFLELFSEMFNSIVKLTTTDWKILSRQIGYEHGDSGSPVLAVFTGGSICAMIAFACPMEIIIYFVAGSQLFSSLLRVFYLFYSPFRPKYMMNTKSKQLPLNSALIETVDYFIFMKYFR